MLGYRIGPSEFSLHKKQLYGFVESNPNWVSAWGSKEANDWITTKSRRLKPPSKQVEFVFLYILVVVPCSGYLVQGCQNLIILEDEKYT